MCIRFAVPLADVEDRVILENALQILHDKDENNRDRWEGQAYCCRQGQVAEVSVVAVKGAVLMQSSDLLLKLAVLRYEVSTPP